jgi:NADH-quinone oxidoreductase subunit G
MVTITVDGAAYEVKEGQNLLQACLSLGLDLPYFCWHPAMASVGACRQCAVKQFRDENDTRGRIVMACMTPAVEGVRISIDDPDARQFRASVIEWLMVNHPHDCPVCDEGGECHLQDMTVLTGHNYREFRFRKRTHRNQDLGPFVNHEMNRCIACYRCVRFYRDYAGGRDFDVFGAHNYVYFGRTESGVLESEFSGNLVEVCPTGVFTDKTLKRHYTRLWDLQTAPSICVHCAVGCNTLPGERSGLLRRIRNRYNGEVNRYFLCDRGRYGYEFVNGGGRIRQPLLRRDGAARAQPTTCETVLSHVAGLVRDGGRVIGIGSPRASLESNFALRALVGAEQFYAGMSEQESRLTSLALRNLSEGPARSPSLREVELADGVLVLGEDVTQTAPMLALALRQSARQRGMEIARQMHIPEWDAFAVREAAQQERTPLFVAALHGTRLDDVAVRTYRAAPDDVARLGFAVAHALNGEAPDVPDLPEEVRLLAEEIARALQAAERPLVVSGTGCGSEAVMQAAANVAWALCGNARTAGLCYVVPECNSVGLGLMGGRSLEVAFHAVQGGTVDTLIVLENDLYRRASAEEVDAVLENARHVMVLDHTAHRTAARAEAVLPVGTFAETGGTLVSNEGRAQHFYQVFVPEGEIREGWRWLRDLAVAAGRAPGVPWHTEDEVLAAMARELPDLQAALEAAPPQGFRMAGQKVPRQSHRFSGRTAELAHLDVHEPKPPDDPDSPLSFSMEGAEGQAPAALIPRFWAPHWNSIQSLNKFQSEIAGPLRGGDPGRRLIEPRQGSAEYFAEIPAASRRAEGQWLLVPIHHIFGSEELSVLAPGIAGLSPRPYVALNPDDAQALRVAEDQGVVVRAGQAAYRLPARLTPALPRGSVGLPVGLPGGQWMPLPAWGELEREPANE